MPGEVCGLRPPAPVLRGGSRIAAVSSPRHAQKSTSRRLRHAPYAYIMNPQNLSPPSAPIGEALPALSPQPDKFREIMIATSSALPMLEPEPDRRGLVPGIQLATSAEQAA